MSNTTQPKTGLFAGKLKGAKVTDRSPYFHPGTYVVRVKKAEWKNCFGPPRFDAYILECEIVKSSRPEKIEMMPNETSAQYEARCAKAPNAVGTSAAYFQSCASAEIGFGALLGFATKVTGTNPNDPSVIEAVEEFLDETVYGTLERDANDQPTGKRLDDGALNGKLIPVEAFNTRTKPKPGFPEGSDFTKLSWGKIIE